MTRFDDESIILAMAVCVGLPLSWNIIARNEYRNHTITRLLFGNKVFGCYLLALYIFCVSLYRDYVVHQAMLANPTFVIIDSTKNADLLAAMQWTAIPLFVVGTILVLAAFYRLGITGTYLGDYFGILMSSRVTKFPFNLFENPMYLGATMNFISVALRENSVVGLGLCVWIYLVYEVSTRYFENPFTAMIYQRAQKQQSAQSKQQQQKQQLPKQATNTFTNTQK